MNAHHVAKALMINDSHELDTSLRALLSTGTEEIRLVTVGNSTDILDNARAEDPDMILLPFAHDGVNGVQLCRRIKADEGLCDIPVVFLIEHDTCSKSRAAALEAGASGFMALPVDAGEFTVQLNTMAKVKVANQYQRVSGGPAEPAPPSVLAHEITDAHGVADEWQAAFNALSDAVWLLDKDMRITRTNRAASTFFGLEPEAMLGRHCWEILHGTQEPISDYPVLRMRHSLVREHLELELEGRWLAVTVDPILDAANELVGAVHIVADITEQKHAAQALRQSEKIFYALFQKAPFAASLSTLSDGRFTLVNEKFESLFGYSRQEVIGKTTADLNLYPDIGVRSETFELVRAHGHIRNKELTLRSASGQLRDVLFNTDIIAVGDETFLLNTAEDISLRKQAEQKLRASEERYRNIVESQEDAVCRWKPDTTLTYTNSHYRTIFGLDQQTELGTQWLAFVPENERAQVAKFYLDLAKNPQNVSYEHEVVLPDGSMRWYHWIDMPLLDSTGALFEFQSVGRDITERKLAEAHIKFQTQRATALLELPKAAETMDELTFMQHGQAITEDLTDSRISFIYFVNEETQTIELATWSHKAPEAYDQEIFERQPSIQDAGIWADALRLKQPVVFNDYATDARVDGAFTVDWPLERLVCVPVIDNGKVVMLVGVGNKATAYTDMDQETVQLIANDIWRLAQRRRAEVALRASENTLRKAQHVAHVGSWTWHVQENRLDWSDEMYRLFGIDKRTFSGKLTDVVNSAIHPDDREAVGLANQAVAQEGSPVPMEYRVVLADGTVRHVWAEAGELIRDEEGTPVSLTGIVQDITEYKLAQEEREKLLAQLSAQAALMQQIIDAVPEGVLVLDDDGRVVLANPVAEKYLPALTQTQGGDELAALGDWCLTDIVNAADPKATWHEIHAQDLIFEAVASPMANSTVNAKSVVVIRDVTLEREIQQRTQQLDRLAAVGQLAAGIAHDFNNIMATIVLYAQMGLAATDVPPKQRERLETIRQQSRKATALIEQILDFGRQSVLELVPMDLTPSLQEAVALLERTIAENILISLDWGPDDYTVKADPTRIHQVMMNLALNARDAMPHGGNLHISMAKTRRDDPINCVTCGHVVGEEWVRITVADSGAGIPPDVLPHLFEPFFTTKEVGKGTGLGLAQVYGIVKQHNGHIDVSTEAGKGATFVVYLPALPAPTAAQTSSPTLEPITEGSGETILIVEDNEMLREVMVDTLDLLNYTVQQAANGRAALELLRQRRGEIDLVMSDLIMPEMGGQELIQAMRDSGIGTPVVIMSGHPLENDISNLQTLGVAGWLVKPATLEQLADTLADILGGTS